MHRLIDSEAIPRAAALADAEDRRLDALHRKPDPLVHYTTQAIEALQQQIAEKDALLRQALNAAEQAETFMTIASDWSVDEVEFEGAMRSTYEWLEVQTQAIAAIRTHLGPEKPAPELIPGVKAALDSLGVGK